MKAKVTYSLGRTVNTGNYENFRISVELTAECEATEVDKAFDGAKKFVRDRVESEVAELLGKTDDED